MSRWRWHVTSGKMPEGNYEKHGVYDDLDGAYDAAEAIYALRHETRRVSLLLQSDTGVGLADSRDPGEGWVVGREQWRASEASAVKAGRA